MTDEQINIAIAEACGWHDLSIVDKTACGLKQKVTSLNGRYEPIPDYVNDLNAMHEAIAFLSPEEADWFAVELSAIVVENPSKSWWDMNSNEVAHIANATARQLAEAFLRYIGKWEEAQP